MNDNEFAMLMCFLIGLMEGAWCAWWVMRGRHILAELLLRKQLGICDRFRGTGLRETRNGTSSEFCINCGHPCGYHK